MSFTTILTIINSIAILSIFALLYFGIVRPSKKLAEFLDKSNSELKEINADMSDMNELYSDLNNGLDTLKKTTDHTSTTSSDEINTPLH